MSNENKRMTNQPDQHSNTPINLAKLSIAAMWVIGFCLLFFAIKLPNNGFVRWDFFRVVPEALMNALFPLQEQGVPHIGWSNISQRIDPLRVSASILVTTWALGSLILRIVYPQGLLDKLERVLFACAIGLSAWSLITLFLGMIGFLSRPLFLGMMVLFIFLELGQRFRKQNDHQPQLISANTTPLFSPLLPRVCLGVMAFFFVWMLLGALLPSTDFDVREYHLQGPKEYYQNGNVSLLRHNVYTSFPFLTEMLTLSAMVVRGDWYWGAIAGKGLLVCFAPLTALALFCAGRRWFGEAAGWLAALIFMTTPWIHRISIIAYAEGGLTFFLFVSLYAVMLALEKREVGDILQRKWQFFFAGLLAGSAMACKYPAALTVVIPLFSVVGVVALRGEGDLKKRLTGALQILSIMTAGWLITVGPWLMKNTIETKNPVYPLVYSVLGGDHWDATMDAKWKKAHSPSHHQLTGHRGMFFWMEDLSARNDWLSPLLYAFAPLAFFVLIRKRMIVMLWCYLFFLFFAWWGLTHRLDRFWVPMIPVVALLAGVGITWSKHIIWKSVAGVCCVVAIVFNIGFNVSPYCGNNSYLYDYTYLKNVTTSPPVALLNSTLKESNARVLCVGEAEVFNTEFPVVYNTVFDDSIFQEWTAVNETDVTKTDIPMKEAATIRETFRKEGITHLLVNWGEIVRYRTSYGFTQYVSPDKFRTLQQMKILGNHPMPSYILFDKLSETEQQEFTKWAPELITTFNGKRVVVTMQMYTVNSN